MGVCALQHRIVTGKYNSRSVSSPKTYYNKPICPKTNSCGSEIFIWIFFGIIYMYQVCLLMAIFIEISMDQRIPTSFTIPKLNRRVPIDCMRDLFNSCFIMLLVHVFRHNNIHFIKGFIQFLK